MSAELPELPPGLSAATRMGILVAQRALRYAGQMAGLGVRPDPLTAPIWWTYRVPCDCNPAAHHRWNCPATPIWAQTMRDLNTYPWTGTATWFMANRDFASLWSAA